MAAGSFTHAQTACNNCPGTVYTTVNSSTMGNLLTNAKFCITNQLIVDADLTLDKCILLMSAGASIVITGSNKLKITNNTYITSCGYGNGTMWQGIHVTSVNLNNFSKLEISNGAIIEDAITAVYTESQDAYCEIKLDNAHFNRNYYSVFIDRANPALLPLVTRCGWLGFIDRCTFTCNSTYNSGINDLLQPPNNTMRSKTHVEIRCAQRFNNIPNGLIPITNSVFDNSNTGVFSFYSETMLNSNTFNNHNMAVDAYFDGALTMFDNTISNVSFGIDVHDAVHHVELLQNTITGPAMRGISVRKSCSGPNDVSFNTITDCSYGIRIIGNGISNTAGYNFRLHQNNISNSSGAAFGIDFIETPNFSPAQTNLYFVDITENEIAGVAVGIRLTNGYKAKIADNNVAIIDNTGTLGIGAINSYMPHVIANNVAGPSLNGQCENTGLNTTGILISNTSDAVVNCNFVDQLNKGVEYFGFTGNATATAFFENTLGFCLHQLYLNKVAYGLGNIGNASFVANNSWTGLNCTSGSYLNTMADASNIQPPLSNFTNIYENVPVPFLNDWINIGSECQFVPTNVVTNGYCSHTPPDDLIALINNIQNDTLYDANYRFWQHQYLMQRVQEDVALTDSLIALQVLIDSLAQTNLGYITAITDTARNYQLDSMTQATLAALQVLNNQVQPDLVLETNYKAVNQIYLYALVNGINGLSTYTKNVLANIAAQCPLSGGKAVYLSRFILEMATNSIVEYSDDCSNYQVVMRYKNAQPASNNTAQVYITDNKINVRFNYQTTANFTFALYNTLGNCVAQYVIIKNTDDVFFDLPNVNGMYIYKITGLASGIINGKLLSVKK